MQQRSLRGAMPLTVVIVAVLVLLVAACGAAPTATPVPPTATRAAVALTSTPIPTGAGAGPTAAPPTATKAASAATPAPPTATTAPAAAQPTATKAAAASSVSFSKDVLPLFQKNCTRCHGGGSPRAGLSLESYQTLMKGAGGRAVVVAGDPDKSPLYGLIKSGAMPFGGTKLPDAETQKIADWIKAGAVDN